MKKSSVILIVSACFLFVGLILGIIGFQLGGLHTSIYVDNEGTHVVKEENMRTETKNFDTFQNVELSTSGVEITFAESDRFAVSYEFTELVEVERLEVVDGTLYVNCRARIAVFNFNVFQRNTLTVYYPEGTEFDKLNVQTGSGSLTADGLFANEAKLASSSGAVKCRNITVEGELVFQANSGSQKIAGAAAESITVTGTSGSISLSDMQAQKGLTAKGSSGSIHITGAKAETLTAACSSGRVRLSDCTVSGTAEASASSGSVNLDKVAAQTLAATAHSGSVTLSDCSAQMLTGQTASGSIRGTGLKTQGSGVKSTSGSINLSGEMSGKNTAQASSGSVHVTTSLAESDCVYLLHSNSGSARVNGEKASGTLNRTSENTFELKASSGSVNLNFGK